jgi:hypothetical protein
VDEQSQDFLNAVNSSLFVWLIGILWLILILYLIVVAIGIKQDAQPHSWQRLGFTLAIVAAFLLPRRRYSVSLVKQEESRRPLISILDGRY